MIKEFECSVCGRNYKDRESADECCDELKLGVFGKTGDGMSCASFLQGEKNE